MTTIFEALETGLTEDGVDLVQQLMGLVTEQEDGLGSLAGVVSSLIEDPPDELGDLVRLVDELELPNLDAGTDLGPSLDTLSQVLPGDMSSVLGPVVDGLADLETTVVDNITQVVANSLGAALAIYELIQIDLLDGSNADNGGSSGNGNGPAPESPTPRAGSEEEPQRDSTLDSLTQVSSFLDTLPEEVHVRDMLLMVSRAGSKRSQLPISIPLLDEIGDLAETLLAWESGDAADVAAHFEQVLTDLERLVRSSVGAVLEPVETGLAGTVSQLRLADLESVATDLRTNLESIASAIAGADLAGTGAMVAAIDDALARFAPLQAAWATETWASLAVVTTRLDFLIDDLEERMAHVMSVLDPASLGTGFHSLGLPEGWADISTQVEELRSTLDTYVAWVWDLVNKIDLQAIQEPLSAVADGARTAVDALDDAMVSVALAFQSLLGEVETLLDQINLEEITNRVLGAIEQFSGYLTEQLTSLLEQVREVLDRLIAAVADALGLFDPSTIQAACQQLMTALAAVLGDGQLQSALGRVSEALETAGDQLEAISFAPLVDLVIDAIEEVTESLESIDASQLNAILRSALEAAVAALPDDITPLIDPLIDELGRLIEEEAPLPQIATALEYPQRLLSEVNRFDPETLLGQVLTEPFEALLQEMRAFQPSSMLRDPLQQALDTLVDRLREVADPGMLLEPLETAFDELRQGFASLNPEELVQPLQDQVTGVMTSITEALQFDELMDQINAVLEKVQEFVSTFDLAKDVLQRTSNLLESLADPETQIRDWLNPILDKLTFPAGTASLDSLVTSLSEAVDLTTAAGLRGRFATAKDLVLTELTAAHPDTLLVPVVQARRAISREDLDGIADFDTEKAAILNLLDRVNPMDPEFSAPFEAVGTLLSALEEAGQHLDDGLLSWDGRFHSDGGVLNGLRDLGTSADGLRSMVEETLETQLIRPLAGILGMASTVRDLLGAVISNVETLITILQEKIEAAILGPDSLGGITEAIGELIERLEGLDLGFITDSLEDLFQSVQDKLDSVSPTLLRETLEEEFENLLGTLDLDQLFPAAGPDGVDPLDETYNQVVAKLEELHPDDLLVQPMQQIYDRDVLPLLQAFDLAELIETLLEKLSGLDEELKTEMERVNVAYRGMLQAVP
jgi:hypothetical protein